MTIQEIELPHSWTSLSKARIASDKTILKRDHRSSICFYSSMFWDRMAGYQEFLIWTSVAEFLDALPSIPGGTKSHQRNERVTEDRIRNLIHDRILKRLKSLTLIVDLPVQLSDEVLFEMQQYLCVGCQAHLPSFCQQKSLFRSPPTPQKCAYTELVALLPRMPSARSGVSAV